MTVEPDEGNVIISKGRSYFLYVGDIASNSFSNCSKLEKVRLSEGLEKIYGYAFENSPMPYITIPKSVNSLLSISFGTRTSDFIICGYAGTTAQTYADTYGFDFIQLGNVTGEGDHTVDNADAALLLKYLNGAADPGTRQLVAARVTDSTKDEPDMLDVIWILNNETA